MSYSPERPPAHSYTELAQTILCDINNDTSRLIDADLDAATREEVSQLESAIKLPIVKQAYHRDRGVILLRHTPSRSYTSLSP